MSWQEGVETVAGADSLSQSSRQAAAPTLADAMANSRTVATHLVSDTMPDDSTDPFSDHDGLVHSDFATPGELLKLLIVRRPADVCETRTWDSDRLRLPVVRRQVAPPQDSLLMMTFNDDCRAARYRCCRSTRPSHGRDKALESIINIADAGIRIRSARHN
jgi:hypothetical protein